jgi:hypothetical protein
VKNAYPELYQCFEEQLKASPKVAGHEEFVEKVIDEYFTRMMRKGHIFPIYNQILREDLRLEILAMFRKKNYGSMTLKTYAVDRKELPLELEKSRKIKK